ncbi:MAG: type III secretion system gatekeeper subunit SctW [Deltaproteobacteria bacterium]|jgi:type III secretion protein W|nr:type III secretion system gatekeeper subunit SctW [Deltaproteobacteria bacterium]
MSGITINDPSAALVRDSQQSVGAEKAANQGALAGLKVTVADNPASRLADAAEELTFSVDNTDELELKERKEKSTADGSLIERVKLYQELIFNNEQKDQVGALAKRLKAAKDGQDALDKAKEFFPDPADAWAVLTELAEEGGEGAEAIRAALDILTAESGREISATMVSVLVGSDFPDLGDLGGLKHEYAHSTIDFPDAVDMLAHIVEKFGADGFERGVEFLNKALAADLALETPSREKSSLETVSSQLGLVRILNGARSLGQKLFDRWINVHGQSDSKLTGMDFLNFVIEGKKQNYPASSVADPLVAKAKPPDVELEVLFRQDLLNTLKSLSYQTFEDGEKRSRFINAVQDGLDLAVAREDEWLASLEE